MLPPIRGEDNAVQNVSAPFATARPRNQGQGVIANSRAEIPVENVQPQSDPIFIPPAPMTPIDLNSYTQMNGPLGYVPPIRVNHRCQVDVIDMQDLQDCDTYKYLFVYEEVVSRFIILKALKSKDPREVAIEIVDIVTTVGAPPIIQSGNGTDYAGRFVSETRDLLRDLQIQHGDAPKNPPDDHRDFKEIMRSWMRKNPGRTWIHGIKATQVSENTSINPHTGKVPAIQFFGRGIREDLKRTIGGRSAMENISPAEAFPDNQCSRKRKHSEDSRRDCNNERHTENLEIITDDDDVEFRDACSSWPVKDNIVDVNFFKTKSEDSLSDLPKKDAIISAKFKHKCTICGKSYIKSGHLRNHMRMHTKVGEFECIACCKSFRVGSLYERHMRRFHNDHDEDEVIADDLVACDRLGDTEECNNSGSNAKKRSHVEEKPDETSPLLSSSRKPKIKLAQLRSKPSRKLTNSTPKLSNNLHECAYCKQKFNFPSVLKRHMRSHTNERPYICNVCNKSFKQLGHLSQHAVTHTDYRSFQCPVCEIKFDSLESLKIHSDAHKDDAVHRAKEVYRLFECDTCKKVFTTKSVLERHVFTHTHERQFGCKVCGKRFKQAGHVKSHMLVHTGERKFECTICSKRFSLSNSLKKHMYVHNGEKPYQCDVCGSRFLEKRNLNGHLMTHTNERPFGCKICGKRYTLADTLKRHVSAAHEDGRTYQCEICAKMFKQLAHLSVHKKVHNDERPFQCHLCDKNFKHKNVLKSHLAIHANVRPFECDVCKATFVRKTNLQTHIASAHMNERPYVCTICNKRFKQISHLNGHIVVHSNSMPYQCNFCDRRCNRLDNLKKHMRLHEKNNKE